MLQWAVRPLARAAHGWPHSTWRSRHCGTARGLPHYVTAHLEDGRLRGNPASLSCPCSPATSGWADENWVMIDNVSMHAWFNLTRGSVGRVVMYHLQAEGYVWWISFLIAELSEWETGNSLPLAVKRLSWFVAVLSCELMFLSWTEVKGSRGKE